MWHCSAKLLWWLDDIQLPGRKEKKRSIKDNKKGAKKKTEVRKTPGSKRKQEPSSDQTGQMLRYVVKTAVEDSRVMNDRNQEAGQVLHKQEEMKTVVDDRNWTDTISDNKKTLNVNQNNMKKTFGSLELQDIRGKIEKFQKFSSNSDNDCLLGSGRCAFHNCRLIRVLSKKKMSVVDDRGNISWDRRDVTSLACPKAAQTKPVVVCDDKKTSPPSARVAAMRFMLQQNCKIKLETPLKLIMKIS